MSKTTESFDVEIEHNRTCSTGVRVNYRQYDPAGGRYYLTVEVLSGWGDDENVSMAGTIVADLGEFGDEPEYRAVELIEFYDGGKVLFEFDDEFHEAAQVLIGCFVRHSMKQIVIGPLHD